MAEKCTFCEKVHFFTKWASADLEKEPTYLGFGAPAPEGPILAKKCTFCTFGADRMRVSQHYMNHGVWDRSPTSPPLRPGRHGRSAPGGMGALPHGGTRALPHAAGRPLR